MKRRTIKTTTLRWLLGGLLSAAVLAGLPGLAAAWGPDTAATPLFTFADVVAVDAVDLNPAGGGGSLQIHGILEGETTVTIVRAGLGFSAFEACHRSAVIMMSRPGQFRLVLGFKGAVNGLTCALERV